MMTKKHKNKSKRASSRRMPIKDVCHGYQSSAGLLENSHMETLLCNQVREDEVLVPKGLPNLGNTCFFNSIMQCLLNTHHFKFYVDEVGEKFELVIPECSPTIYDKQFNLKEAKIPVEFEEEEMEFVDTFKDFITEFLSGRSPHPRQIFRQLSKRNPRFRGWQQQDSHEALRALIDEMQQEELYPIECSVKNYLQHQGITEDSNLVKRALMNFAKPVLDRVFAGSLLQTILCDECGHLSVRFEPFLDLSLPIPKNSNSAKPQQTPSVKADRTLETALDNFTRNERLEGDNAYECEKCCVPINKEAGKREKTVAADKNYYIHLLPPVLTLNLKRFEKTQLFGRTYTSKISSHVKFPLILDVMPYCSEVSEPIKENQVNVLYSLYGIVCHSGSLNGGHYIAYVRSRKPIDQVEKFFYQASFFDASSVGDFVQYEKVHSEAAMKDNLDFEELSQEEAIKSLNTYSWYYCSDSHVSQVYEEEILEAEAFMLFYERFY